MTCSAVLVVCCLQGKKYLEENVLPAGVRAVPVERVSWINSRIDCGPAGFLSVENSRTDYLLLLTECWTLQDMGGDMTEELVQKVLPYIVGLYEVGTQAWGGPQILQAELFAGRTGAGGVGWGLD